MKRLWSLVVLAVIAVVLSISPRAASAADDEAAKLAALGKKALRYTLKTTNPPSSIDTGGAAILVNAPIAAVRKIVTSYGSYHKFISPFDQSRVLSKSKGVSEVYLQVPILNGAVHIWTVAELQPPAKDGADELIAGRFKRGNIDDFRANWRLRAVDADHTILKLELLVDPKLPVPSSLVTTQLVKAADKAVTAVRNRAEMAASAGAKPSTVSATATVPGAAAARPEPLAADAPSPAKENEGTATDDDKVAPPNKGVARR